MLNTDVAASDIPLLLSRKSIKKADMTLQRKYVEPWIMMWGIVATSNVLPVTTFIKKSKWEALEWSWKSVSTGRGTSIAEVW